MKWADEYGKSVNLKSAVLISLTIALVVVGVFCAALGILAVSLHSPFPYRSWDLMIGGLLAAGGGVAILNKHGFLR